MNNIKTLRLAKNLTQTELAQKINVKQNTLSNWETGRTEPDINSLRKLADILEAPIEELLGVTAALCGKTGNKITLTPEELALLAAYRRSDERTREIVRLTLEPYGDFSQAKPATA